LIEGECLWRLDRDKEAVELRVAKIEDARWFDDARRCQRLRAPDELSGKEDAATVVRAHAARAMVLLDGGQPVLALEDAEKAAGAEEKSGRRTADTEVVLAATLLRNDRSADALAAAGRATQDDPRNPDGWALRGRLEQESANFAAAVEDLSQALAIREDASWLRRRETCLRILGRNAEADRDAQRAAQAPAST
jgi:tetratricopeptide (TPR) repeat protein